MSERLTQSDEDYLETIFQACDESGGIRLTDMAKEMKVSKASANQAVEKLKSMNLVSHEKYGIVYLTEKGKGEAGRIDRRHKAIRMFLADILKVSLKTAEKDACLIEHVISPETMGKLRDFTEGYLKKE
ncbi:MAG: metal-dependent transcriptional regulator [Clostridia bacterium]